MSRFSGVLTDGEALGIHSGKRAKEKVFMNGFVRVFKRVLAAVLLVGCAWGGVLHGEDPRGSSAENAAEEKERPEWCKSRFLVAPFVFYSPETSVAFGGAVSYIFRTAGCSDEESKTSSFSPVLIYTVKGQVMASLNGSVYSRSNNYYLNGSIRFLKFPGKFYGVGPAVRESEGEDYTPRTFEIVATGYRRIGRGVNAGLHYHLSKWDIVEQAAGGKLELLNLPGSRGGFISGLGFYLNVDTRDNQFSPFRGQYMEGSVRVYPRWLGGDFEYTHYSLDLRGYIPLFGGHTLAAQAVLQSQTGRVPIVSLAQMGGDKLMRGYFEGRFRDRNLLAVQLEHRFPISGRFRGVVFAGVGDVGPGFGDLDFSGAQFSWGGGIRFLFDRKERICLRFDYGVGKDSSGFYFGIFEAF